ncbi:MAG TPA: autotransporter-associated beta strand repeat-containing protein [Burkholderiales bacterium]|nr:autotransporter-associated beta strand repeat-containing protein [Burkholderiales bacterium]
MRRKAQRLRIRPKLAALAVAACFASEPAFANPTGPVVVNGQVMFGVAGSVLTVTNSPNSIINWQRFSIGAGETTRFIQQSAASAVLNRVVGADPSSILGALQSNGRVFLINPNGIIFGPGSQVDVAGLVASTLNLSNEDFLGGRLNFVGDPAKAAAVVNQGRITASEGGRVYLVGSAVDNQGIISAPNGEVVLAAGSSVRVTDSPGSRLQVEITAPGDSTVNLSEAVYGSRGIYGGLVRNSGTISANAAVRTADGRIVLKASKDVTLESTSVVSASGAQGGAVTAQADTGTLLVDGRVDATGSEAEGGTVQLLGEQVGLVNQAVVDASGAAGRGTVNVGGSRQGEGPLPNSRAVFIGSDTRIAANATTAGDGGTVIVYADDAARIHGALEARGGPEGGNGGFVETSGKQFLDVTRLPDVTAASGDGGEWLIDPFNITITVTANQCNNLTGCVAGPDWTSSANNAQLGVNLINNALDAGTSVTVTTGAGGVQAGNITFANNAAVNKTAGGNASLTVTAANNIAFGSGANITSSSGQLDVNLNAGSAITNLRAIDTNGGTLTLNNSTTITQAAGGISGSGALVKDGTGTLTLSQNNTYTGGTTINAGTVIATNAGGLGDAAGGTTVNTGATLELRGTLVWAEPVTLAGGTLSRGTGNPTLTGAVDLAADSVITGAAGILTLSGDVSGTGALTKTGSNTVVLSGNNTYSGATNINGGTLTVTSAGALGSAASGTTVSPGATLALNGTLASAEPVTLAGGTLSSVAGAPVLSGAVDLASDSTITGAGGTTLTLSGDVSGAGALTKTGASILLLSGSNTYIGATNVNTGTLRVAGGNGIGDASSVNVAGGTLDLNGATETIGSLAGTSAVTLGAGTLVAGGNDASTTYSGVMSGAGTLTKEGTGTLTLAGNNSYTGATNVIGGTLALGNSNRISNASAVTVVAGATFDLAGFSETVGSIAGAGTITTTAGAGTITLNVGGDGTSTTFSGVIENPSGTLALTKAGAGTLTLSGANTYTGTTTVSGGTLQFAGGGALEPTNAVVLVNGAGVTLDLNGTNQTIGSLAGGGGTGGVVMSSVPGAVTLTTGSNGSSTNFAGSIQDGSGTLSLTKVGSGTFALSGTNANTYTGPTTISAGTLALGNDEQIPDTSAVTVAAGAIFDLVARTETIGSLAGAGTVSKTGAGTDTLTIGGDNSSTTFSGVIQDPAGTLHLTKVGTGTLTLSGANTHSGTTTVNDGTLRLAGGNAIADTGAVSLANTPGATLDLNGSNETIGSLTGGGAAGGNVTLGAGTLTTGGNNATTTFSGAISGTGGVTKEGTGNFTLASANTFDGIAIVNAGTLTVTDAGALGSVAGGTTVNAGATLSLNGSLAWAEPVTLAGGTLSRAAGDPTLTGAVDLAADSVITEAAGTLTLSGDISGVGGFSKAGNGVLLLSGNNTYAGATIGNAGTLRVAGGNGIGDTSAVTMVGGTLDINNTAETIGSLGGTRPVTLGTGTLVTGGNDASTAYTGVISGAGGALTKEGAGTFTLAANNTYTGATNINGGTLVANHNNALGTTAGGTTVASGATLEIANGVAIGAETLNLSGAGVGGSGALIVASGSGSFAGAVTLGANTSLGGDGNLTLSGIVNDTALGTSVLTQVGNGLLTFSNTVGATNALAGMTTSAGQSTALNGGSVRTTGSQSYGGTVATGGATTLTSTAGGDISANNAGNDFIGDLALNTSGAAGIVDSGALTLGASSVGTLTARALGGDLSLNGTITAAGGGDSIVLAAAGNFANNAGAAALNPGAGRWLVYSTDPALDVRGGLAYSFKQYNAPFGTAPAGASNGFLYSVAPVITPSLVGSVSKVYDGTTAAAFAAGNYTFSGAIDGDVVTLNNPAAGNYDTKHVGTSKQVTASGIAIASATDGAATVYGYQLSSTSASANIGDITPAALALNAVTDTKVYDGGTSSAGAPTATGLVGGDTVGSLTQSFASKDVLGLNGSTLSVDAGYVVNDGNAGANYTVTLNTANGTITPAPLSITADDASRAQGAANPPFTATYSGFRGGETPAVLTGMLNFNTPAVVSSPTGMYPITPFGQSSLNYAITYVDGALTVTGGFPVVPAMLPVDGATNLIVGGFEQLGIATNGRTASCSTSNQPNGIELMAGASGWAHWTCATAGK